MNDNTDNTDTTAQTVYELNGITLLPHYTLPCYVTPGFTNATPMKLWTVRELEAQGANKRQAFLWPRRTLASGGGHG
jgi:hypothetical protein